MKKRFIIIGVVIVAGVALGYYFLGNNEEADPVQVGQVVRTVKIERGNLDLTVSSNGVVQPIRKVEIRSKASGQILELNFEEGSYVNKGDLLVALDQTQTKNDYEQAKADLASAQQSLSQAENNANRSKELHEKGLISDQERDQSKLDLVKAQSQLVRATAALSSADERLRDTRILAPISGIILSRNVDLGQIISSAISNVGGGTILATVADMQEVYVITNVDEVDIGRVKEGQTAKVVADAYPDDTFTGEVLRVAPLGKTQQNVTTFNVIVLVKNVGGKLKSGMSATVDIEIFRRQNVVLVPNEALKDPRSEQGRALLASLRSDSAQTTQSVGQPVAQREETKDAKPEKELSIDELRQKMQNATSQEERDRLRQLMRERFEKMSPEERQRMFAQFQQRMAGSQGGQMGPGGMMGGGSGDRPRRQSQVGNTDEVKRRVVVVKDGEQFIPRMITVGPSNFEYSEVLQGLSEGDEIQITSISRAKLAQEQMNERMRSMGGLSGVTGGGRVPAGGGGRH